jgi:hypothetical protein
VAFSRSLALLALGAGAAVACGPSFQAVYECDVRFEHCYAIDQGAGGINAKKACWREWLQSYTYGESRDRVEYAATRLSELSLDPTLPSVDRDVRPVRAHNVAAPVPTNAFAPPPNLAEHAQVDPPAASASSTVAAHSAPHAPGEDCTQACQDKWKGCRETCKDGACAACDRSYRGCVPACFRPPP